MTELEQALQARPFPARVAEVLDAMRVVINRGSRDGLRVGKRFLIYGIGPEITDPETGEPLGKVELVRGRGVVVHVQDAIATVESDRTETPERRVVKRPPSLFGPAGMFGQAEEEIFYSPADRLPFDGPTRGDLVKPI